MNPDFLCCQTKNTAGSLLRLSLFLTFGTESIMPIIAGFLTDYA